MNTEQLEILQNLTLADAHSIVKQGDYKLLNQLSTSMREALLNHQIKMTVEAARFMCCLNTYASLIPYNRLKAQYPNRYERFEWLYDLLNGFVKPKIVGEQA